jgi:Helix-turn-helix domain
MEESPHAGASKPQLRVQAVLALFRGVPPAQVSTQFGICRSDLYKFRRRALAAIHQALDDRPRGPKTPHNRLDPDTELRIASLCRRYPTWSSYEIHQTPIGTPHPARQKSVPDSAGCGFLSRDLHVVWTFAGLRHGLKRDVVAQLLK